MSVVHFRSAILPFVFTYFVDYLMKGLYGNHFMHSLNHLEVEAIQDYLII